VAVPKRKTTPSKRDMRRANHDKVTPVQLVKCEHCSEPTLPHRACANCGYYKGRKVKATKTSSES
jgi:large subunit ribosomal protein L32